MGAGRFDADLALARRRGFRFEPAFSSSQFALFDRLRWTWLRLCSRVGRVMFRYLRAENRWQLGPLVSALLGKARAEHADCYIAHNEQALWAGQQLLREGYRVGIDMEDWYSEDLLPEARKLRPLKMLSDLERRLLCSGTHASCPSAEMSEALATAYECAPPAVVYNAFPWSDRASIDGLRKDRRSRAIPSIHWYSQTLGPGRGLEDLFAALPHLKGEVEVHLRGNPVAGLDRWLKSRIPRNWRSSVFVHGVVSNDELLSRIAEHDIGFAGEMKYCRSRDLTVTNKILHYLLAGLTWEF